MHLTVSHGPVTDYIDFDLFGIAGLPCQHLGYMPFVFTNYKRCHQYLFFVHNFNCKLGTSMLVPGAAVAASHILSSRSQSYLRD